jgi:hypothetical protein
MSVAVEQATNDKVVVIKASGRLSKDDYEHFVPKIERLIKEHGKIRILFEMHEFHGWKLGALWEDIKFDVRHFTHIERIAMVGEKKWEKWMAEFCCPFTAAKIRYFDHSDIETARAWIEEA